MGRTRNPTASETNMTQSKAEQDLDDLDEQGGEFERKPVTIEVLNVVVDHGPHNKTITEIFAWELPVLEEIYGEDAVEILRERTMTTTLTAGEAHRMLMFKYRGQEKDNGAVKRVFRNARELSKKMGLPHHQGDRGRAYEAPPAIDHSGDADPTLLGNTAMAIDPVTRRA
jgi:hypothetical protein